MWEVGGFLDEQQHRPSAGVSEGWLRSGPPSGSWGPCLTEPLGLHGLLKLHHCEVIKKKKICQPRDCREGRQSKIGKLRREKAKTKQNAPLNFRSPGASLALVCCVTVSRLPVRPVRAEGEGGSRTSPRGPLFCWCWAN